MIRETFQRKVRPVQVHSSHRPQELDKNQRIKNRQQQDKNQRIKNHKQEEVVKEHQADHKEGW